MKGMVRLIAAMAVIAACVAVRANAQTTPQTWTGKISDSMCGADHKANGGTLQKDHDCTIKCAKDGKYVFVNSADKKVLNIANQNLADLATHGGHLVEITGELKGDTLTIAKVKMLPQK